MRKQIKWPPHLCILDTDIMMEKSDRVVHRSQNIKGREKNTGTNSKKKRVQRNYVLENRNSTV